MKQRKATPQPASTKWKQRSSSILIFQPLTETTTPSCTPWTPKRQKQRSRSLTSCPPERWLLPALPAPSRMLAKRWMAPGAVLRFRPRRSHYTAPERLPKLRPFASLGSPTASTGTGKVWIQWKAEIRTPSRSAGGTCGRSSANRFPWPWKRPPCAVTLV